MGIVLAIASFIVNQILSVPAFLVGIVVAIGLIALRRNTGQVIGGALKAVLGFLILSAGASVVTSSLEPLGEMILGATGAQGVVPTNEAIVSIAQNQFGTITAWVMIAGFAVAIILARFTPLKYVFLTGHHVFFMATMLTVVLATAKVSSVIQVVVGAILLGTIMVVMPALAHPWMKKVTGNNKLAIGHFGTLGYIVSGAIGQAVGRRSKSTEDMRLPQSLHFLRDSMVATALSMVLFYAVFCVAYLLRAGTPAALKLFNSPDVGAYVVTALTKGLMFGVGVAIILYGVRIILGELVPAFQGIAEKVVPGAVPALDCPIVFPFAPNAVLIGFIFSFAGGLLSLGALALIFGPLFGLALILPGMVPHFFTGGAAGVFGNATGGRRGAMCGAFANGIIITVLPALLLKVLGSLGFANTTFGDADFGWYGTLIGHAIQAGPIIGIILTLIIAAILVVGASWWQRRVVNRGWLPAAGHTEFLAEVKKADKAKRG
ncbi:PTS ascorbate transporter subunit IIC [Devriesea agamarum]|uniref:PTS ascorbate transporter subunit IIC n=1 Tax=Devriesea agamarum TaxID=472569 RepID=UPI00071E0ED1|nr:PTS ascorbate transporter subunit IIC [Devriesea agamarum]